MIRKYFESQKLTTLMAIVTKWKFGEFINTICLSHWFVPFRFFCSLAFRQLYLDLDLFQTPLKTHQSQILKFIFYHTFFSNNDDKGISYQKKFCSIDLNANHFPL